MGAFNVSVSCLYIFTGCFCVLSVWIWLTFIPVPGAYNQQTPRSFIDHLKKWREWFPLITQNSIALCVDMFFVSAFSAMNQFVLSDDTVPLLGHLKIDAAHMSFDNFMVVYSLCTFIGDTGGRKVVYWWDLQNNPLWFLLSSFAGGILCVVKIPILMWLGGFAIFFANGLIYAATTKRIDASVGRIFNLTSLSVWLFVGDVGSVTGSNTWEILEPLVCANEKHSRYFCNS
ncbi:hypothetical protein RFI_23383 [Reticulomyxa filosa]|uniref:Uncharacterized protein n=1 Tax=Reticulomyxa filosa TaxID=46433 RepID=X6MLP0_RETFI|nr:hypothetical protein RFI_23383 [Reticulomyxa filosa]|eukprot:ETO13985.1 hypothetical protein RFI_23383 [Reticulomyxa filosa]